MSTNPSYAYDEHMYLWTLFRGEQFRHKYKDLPVLRSIFRYATWLLVTATLTQELKDQTLGLLGLASSKILTVAMCPNRPNIYLSVKADAGMDYAQEFKWYIDELRNKGVCARNFENIKS